jgi:hypothetical protein
MTAESASSGRRTDSAYFALVEFLTINDPVLLSRSSSLASCLESNGLNHSDSVCCRNGLAVARENSKTCGCSIGLEALVSVSDLGITLSYALLTLKQIKINRPLPYHAHQPAFPKMDLLVIT